MTTLREADEYLPLSHHYIRQADYELSQEDYLQAEEKAWGAVATAIKAIAEKRGWPHNHHDLTGQAMMWLADEFARQDLKDSFTLIERLHRNFYEDTLTEQEVQRGVGQAKLLLEELDAFRNTPSPDVGRFIPESNRQKRRWEKLTGRKWEEA